MSASGLLEVLGWLLVVLDEERGVRRGPGRMKRGYLIGDGKRVEDAIDGLWGRDVSSGSGWSCFPELTRDDGNQATVAVAVLTVEDIDRIHSPQELRP